MCVAVVQAVVSLSWSHGEMCLCPLGKPYITLKAFPGYTVLDLIAVGRYPKRVACLTAWQPRPQLTLAHLQPVPRSFTERWILLRQLLQWHLYVINQLVGHTAGLFSLPWLIFISKTHPLAASEISTCSFQCYMNSILFIGKYYSLHAVL